jgi:hypothetical protein
LILGLREDWQESGGTYLTPGKLQSEVPIVIIDAQLRALFSFAAMQGSSIATSPIRSQPFKASPTFSMMAKERSRKVVLVDEALLRSLLEKVEMVEARLKSLSGEGSEGRP